MPPVTGSVWFLRLSKARRLDRWWSWAAFFLISTGVLHGQEPGAAVRTATDSLAPTSARVAALVELLAPQGVALRASTTIASILQDSSETRCPLAPGKRPEPPAEDAVDSLAYLTERLYRSNAPAPLRLFARCARVALSEGRPLREESGVVAGVVSDSAGQPIAGAEVVDLGEHRRARTNPRGEFALAWLAPGPHLFMVRAIGRQPKRFSTTVEIGDSLSVDVMLDATPQQLRDLVVTARGKEYRGKMADVARRMITAPVPASRFILREEIERWAPFDLSNVFRRAGLDVQGDTVVCPRTPSFSRPPKLGVWVDGVQFSEETWFDTKALPIQWIEAIELYKGAAEIPIEYTKTGVVCVVLIWTREP